jgi:hypothetical protein
MLTSAGIVRECRLIRGPRDAEAQVLTCSDVRSRSSSSNNAALSACA